MYLKKWPDLREIYWLSPPDRAGENVSSVLLRYVEKHTKYRHGDKNPVLIYAASESMLEEAIEAQKKFNVPIIMHFWGWMPERFTELEWRKHYKKKIDLINNHVYQITIPSSFAADQLRTFGIQKTMYYLQGAVDFDLAISITQNHYVTQHPFVCSVGRLVPHKNFGSVLRALSKTNIHYMLVGSGPLKQALEEEAKYCEASFSILNDANDIKKFEVLSTSVAVIVPSLYEGFGMAIAEGATVGVPIIAYELPVFRELFGDNIIYYKNSHELKLKIHKLLGDSDYRKEYICKGAYLALKYSGQSMSQKIADNFRSATAMYIKDVLDKRHCNNEITTKEVYDCNALLDQELYPHRLDPENCAFTPRLRKLLEYAKKPDILDIGSANGVFSILLAAHGYNVTAIDISEEYLKIASETAKRYCVADRIKFQIADALDLPFENNTFDCVWMGEILEHFVNSDAIISEALRVLKITGHLVFTVPQGDACYDPVHKQIFNTTKEVKNLFKNFDNINRITVEPCSNTIDRHNWAGYGVKIG